MTRSVLASLFEPRSIAVVGASASIEKVGYQLVDALSEFPGEVLPINPKAREVAGRIAYPELRAAPSVPDLVLLAVPALACVDALGEAAALGARAAVIVSGGFAESGEEGARLQSRLQGICRDSGLRLLGPNTSGYTRPAASCHASFVPAVRRFSAGPLSIVAQSGGVNLTLAFLAQRQRLGIRLAVGLGNAVDVGAADVIEYLAQDDGTQVIAVHLEGVLDGRRLYEVIAATTPRKPVIVLPVGRAQVGDFARSHTGNLMGSHLVTASALRQAGAIVVDSTDELVDSAAAFTAGRIEAKRSPGVGILTGQAGPGLIILDALRSRNVSVPALAATTVAEIAAHVPPMTYLQNPIDTGRPSPAFADVLMCAAKDPAIDVLLTFALEERSALDPVAVFARAKELVAQPMLFATLGDPESIEDTRASLQPLNVPVLLSPERAAVAARALVEDATARWRRATVPQYPTAIGGEVQPAHDEATAKRLLSMYGVATPRSETHRTHAAALAGFHRLEKPIAVKVLDAAIAHKTEVGGVHLHVRTAEQLNAALQRIDAIPGGNVERGYLLEEMAPPGVDLILGARRDPSFGPTVLVGLGGTEAEALKDVSVRCAPLSDVDVNEMLDELRGRALLEGWRGARAIDRTAVIHAVQAIAALIVTQPTLRELDINPLRCTPEGVLALDALMIWDAT